jgi:hypothetical protein
VNTNLAVDPKLTASALGQAASTILWTLLLVLWDGLREGLLTVGAEGIPDASGAGIVAVLVGSTGLLLSVPFGYMVRNAASPPALDGVGIEQTIEERVPPAE